MRGMRLGQWPRIVATTTPRPVPLLRRLVREGDVVVTRGRTAENGANLPGSFLSAMESGYQGTRLGRRSEEHTSELQSLMRISYAVFCLKQNNRNTTNTNSKTVSREQSPPANTTMLLSHH